MNEHNEYILEYCCMLFTSYVIDFEVTNFFSENEFFYGAL